jgi:hypothetical protein
MLPCRYSTSAVSRVFPNWCASASPSSRYGGLAERIQRWIANRSGRVEGGEQSVQDPAIAQLAATAAGVSTAWDRLCQIASEHHRPQDAP